MPLRTFPLAALASTTLLSACGASTATQSAAPPQTVTETVATAVPVPEATEPATTPKATPAAAPSTRSAADCTKVPGVVGKDHQLAQDTMQAAGLYALDEEDATGQGRMLIIDRNWTVVSQQPAAGACVDPDTTILLRSKKDGE